ncbi:MAG: thioredoxin-dependent thiol peroxidase [Flavobacteriales bacterium]|jgi:peroxiredoxin Q/BCP|tara:strand:- start:6085 stop:6543 length:459 start_codon:yes stop_codon:yes gene_type:complete
MTHLQVGDSAPDFAITNQSGELIKLSDFSDKKLIIFFYPKDNTPGCTAESCNLKDNYSDLLEKGFEVVGVSADDAVSHQKFIAKFSLPYNLLADTNKEMIKSYGVWGEKKFMGKVYDGIHRTTFIINNGVVEKIFLKVKTKEHSNQIIESYK